MDKIGTMSNGNTPNANLVEVLQFMVQQLIIMESAHIVTETFMMNQSLSYLQKNIDHLRIVSIQTKFIKRYDIILF